MSKFPEYKHTKSHEYFDRAIKVIPSGIYGHLGPAEGLWVPVSKWPFYSEKAKGTYFWDVDGNKYIDYMCAYGPNVLGYNDPDVDAAAMKQMKLGLRDIAAAVICVAVTAGIIVLNHFFDAVI